MAEDLVRYELSENVAIAQLDDGKANALSPDMIEAIHASLDRAEGEAASLVLAGRPGKLSAGFDLSVMRTGPDAVRRLVGDGAELLLRIFSYPLPTVVACSGHALAAGAILLLVADHRIGARGPYKIGLNEVAIGMTLPGFGIEFARNRLSKRHFDAAAVQSRIYDPETAVSAGFLDQVCESDDLQASALRTAQELAALPSASYRATKLATRAAIDEKIRAELPDELARLTGPASS